MNSNSGYITTRRRIDTDSSTSYFVIVKAFDTAYPNQLATATATISVTRNTNEPIFSEAVYRRTVHETAVTGTVVVRVEALDQDGVNIVCFRVTTTECFPY